MYVHYRLTQVKTRVNSEWEELGSLQVPCFHSCVSSSESHILQESPLCKAGFWRWDICVKAWRIRKIQPHVEVSGRHISRCEGPQGTGFGWVLRQREEGIMVGTVAEVARSQTVQSLCAIAGQLGFLCALWKTGKDFKQGRYMSWIMMFIYYYF